jgi:ubiquinone/menaquinone biosynthesis C-methylase UbiE
MPVGSTILDAGGGYSRILSHLKNDYECWCIDKYEGLGNGPKDLPGGDVGYRTVIAYMGNFNSDLPDDYFDLVFSVSALEHTPLDAQNVINIIEDINRVLKTGGFSLHCLDMLIDKTAPTCGNIIHSEIFKVAKYQMPSYPSIISDRDLYVLPKNIFDTWNLGRSYDELCVIDSCAFWQK